MRSVDLAAAGIKSAFIRFIRTVEQGSPSLKVPLEGIFHLELGERNFSFNGVKPFYSCRKSCVYIEELLLPSSYCTTCNFHCLWNCGLFIVFERKCSWNHYIFLIKIQVKNQNKLK